MSIGAYTLLTESIEFDPNIVETGYYKPVVICLFNQWQRKVVGPDIPMGPVPVISRIELRTEGLSGVEVVEVIYVIQENSKLIARFILRRHKDGASLDSAGKEREVVRRIQAMANDAFSSNVEEYPDIPTEVVIYRHAADEVGGDTQTLYSAIKKLLMAEDEYRLSELCRQIRSVLLSASKAYRIIDSQVEYLTGEDFGSTLRDRLPPDLFIDLRGASVNLREGVISVAHDDIFKENLGSCETLSGQKLFDQVFLLNNGTKKWICCDLKLGVRPFGRTYINFLSDKIRIALRAGSEIKDLLSCDEHTSYSLVIYLKDGWILPTSTIWTRDLRLPVGTWIADSECQYPFTKVPRLSCVSQHTDLHGGNILYADGRLKIIDLASFGREPVGSMHARLEISLWNYLVQSENLLTVADAASVLDESVTPDNDERLKQRSWRAWAFRRIVASIRGAFDSDDVIEAAANDFLPLAYASQLMVFGRYWLEQGGEVSQVLGFYAKHRLDEFLSLGSNQDPLCNPSGGQISIERKRTIAEGTLGALWELAARVSSDKDSISPRAEELIDALWSHVPEYMSYTLTPLQRRFMEHENEMPFKADKHVIIAGPTSSGKSTVAEMFLVGPWLEGVERRCALYIAPTRALAQAKYRDLRARFNGLPSLASEIVLSTGEDTDEDYRVAHGRFAIACIVYEKANILFSRNRRLLSSIGCLVVDEIHMIANLDRGPVLETALTKVLRERDRIEGNEVRMRADTIRIVAISTEDKPDQTMESLLCVRDAFGNTRNPLVLHQSERPIAVRHCLVLPASTNSSKGLAYEEFLITEFSNSDQRALPRQQIDVILRRLASKSKAMPAGSAMRPRSEMEDRMVALLMDLLAQRPLGYRVLVFVPGREQAELLAQRLKKSRKSMIHGSQGELLHRKALDALRQRLDEIEDKELGETLRACAAVGIFIHHSDIERKLREAIEEICSTCPPDMPSQVLFSTETLAYGVNLATHDVVLLGTAFNTQDRQRIFDTRPLDTCQFHNMAGRAGRLGRTSSRWKPSVYVVVPFIASGLGADIVNNYYSGIDPVESQLFVKDDGSAMIREDNFAFKSLSFIGAGRVPDAGLCDKYKEVRAIAFSDPFVRSVLDALRHVNRWENAGAGTSSPVAAPIKEVLRFFSITLYRHQRLTKVGDGQEQLFYCALERVLDDCAEPPLDLVKIDRVGKNLYTILPRGEAIIDTGTEIRTVEPLLDLVQLVRGIWKQKQLSESLPSELYLLCLISQAEVCRQCIAYAPEISRGGGAWHREIAVENRELVLTSFVASLKLLGVPEPEVVSQALRDMLEQWITLRRVLPKSFSESYDGSTADAVIRFFNAMVIWTRGESRGRVFDLVEKAPRASLDRNWQSFSRFTDQLSYKCQFLGKVLAPSGAADVSVKGEDERNLNLLAFRVRLGCSSDAIPLFYPQGSNINRSEAGVLLEAGLTPRRILSAANIESLVCSAMPIDKASKLKQDLQSFAIKNFSELKDEVTLGQDPGYQWAAITDLWADMAGLLERSIRSFDSLSSEIVNLDEALRKCFNFGQNEDRDDDEEDVQVLGSSPKGSVDSRYRLCVKIEGASGFSLFGERYSGERDENARGQYHRVSAVKVIGLQMRSDWWCRVGGKPWRSIQEVIVEEWTKVPLVIVPLPWLPDVEDMPEEAKIVFQKLLSRSGFVLNFVYPAAFAVIMSLIVRDFVSGEKFVEILSEVPESDLFRVLAARRVQEILDEQRVAIPPDVRERLLQHFDVGP